jgi:hypothetical protein
LWQSKQAVTNGCHVGVIGRRPKKASTQAARAAAKEWAVNQRSDIRSSSRRRIVEQFPQVNRPAAVRGEEGPQNADRSPLFTLQPSFGK